MNLFKTLLSLLTLLLCLTGSRLKAAPLQSTIYTTAGRPIACWLTAYDQSKATYSLNAAGGSVKTLPVNQIKKIELRNPKGWLEALELYNAGDYNSAETLFAKLSAEYAPIALLTDRYGALARYYYLTCLKNNGKNRELAAEFSKMKSQPISLNPAQHNKLKTMEGWALLGSKNWKNLLEYTEQFLSPLNAQKHPRRSFVPNLGSSTIAELSYLRAVALLEATKANSTSAATSQKNTDALEHLARSISINFGNPTSYQKDATQRLIEALQSEDNQQSSEQATSLKAFLKEVVNNS